MKRVFMLLFLINNLALYAIANEKTSYITHIEFSSNWESFLRVESISDNEENISITLYENGNIVKTITKKILPKSVLNVLLDVGSCGVVQYSSPKLFFKQSFINIQEGGIAEFELNDVCNKTLSFLLSQYNGVNLTWTGIAIFNPSDNDSQINLTAYDEKGNLLASTETVVHSKTTNVEMVFDFFDELDFRDVARIQAGSNENITGIVIAGNHNRQLLFTKAMSYFPIGNLNISHIATEWEYWKNIIILDNLSSTVTQVQLKLFSDGVLVLNEAIDIDGGNTKVIDLRQFSELDPQCGILINNSKELAIRQSFINRNQGGTAEFLLSNEVSFGDLIYSFPSNTEKELNWMGLSCFNTNELPQTIKVIAWKGGEKVGTTDLYLNGFERIAFTLSSIFSDLEIDKVVIENTGGLAGINISGENQEKLLFTQGQFETFNNEDCEFKDLLQPEYYNVEDNSPFANEVNRFISYCRKMTFHHPMKNENGQISQFFITTSGIFGSGKGLTNTEEYHPAVDLHVLNNQTNVSLYAAYDGYVTTYRDAQKYRQYLSISSDVLSDNQEVIGKLVTIYAHIDLDLDEQDGILLNGCYVKKGDKVSQHLYSETVGGPHLHFEIRFYRAEDLGNESFYGIYGLSNSLLTEQSTGPWIYGYWNPNVGYGFGDPKNHGLFFY